MSNRRFPTGMRPRRGLGDLDEFKLAEREELFERQPGIPTPGSEIPPSLPTGYLAQPSGLNIPDIGLGVKSVYDARPVNGKDWTAFFKVQCTVADGGKALVQVQFPEGFIAVFRRFSYQVFNSSGLFEPDKIILMDFGINFSGDPNRVSSISTINNQGTIFDNRYPAQVINQETFLIVPEKSNLTIGISSVGSSAQITFELYGNLLKSRGLPSNFEIAS